VRIDPYVTVFGLARFYKYEVAESNMTAQGEAQIVFTTEKRDLQGIGVTVVVTLYNYEAYIKNALDSVFSQSYPNIELVVVDDASHDGSLDTARWWLEQNSARFSRAILLTHLKNAGVARARNSAFANATNEYVFVLDADNELKPEAIAKLLSACISAGTQAAYSRIEKFGEETGTLGGVWKPSALARGNYIDAMALIRKSAWKAAGGYDGTISVQGWEDYDLWCKFVELGFKGEFVPESLCRYRVHRTSMLRVETNPKIDKLKLEMRQRHPWLKLQPPAWKKAYYWLRYFLVAALSKRIRKENTEAL